MGKTSLIKNWIRNYKLNDNYVPNRKCDNYDGEQTQAHDEFFDLQVIDTPGGDSEHIKRERQEHYKECNIFMFCFAENNHRTLLNLEQYYKEVEEYLATDEKTKGNCVKFLIGCKFGENLPAENSQGN